MTPTPSKAALLLAGLLSLTQFGCNKLVDVQPLDALSDNAYWQTANDFMLASNQSYTYLRTFNDVAYDVYTPVQTPTRQNYHADFKGDLLSNANLFSRGQNSVPSVDPVYTQDYQRIRNVNYLLDKASTYIKPADIAKYVAEAKFFRAYLYFDLLQIYGGVPIISKLLAVDSPELQAPRNTRDEVTDFIISDLRAALTGLPTKATQPAAEVGRINQETVQAFLGRVALYEGTWQKFRGNASRATTLLDASITASNTVITGGQYSLFAPAALGDSAQKYMFILEDVQSNPRSIAKSANNEYILANRYSASSRYIGVNITQQAASTSGVVPTKNFANQFLASDGLPIEKSKVFQGFATPAAEYVSRDNRMRYTLRVPGRRYWYGNASTTARVDFVGGAGDLGTGTVFNPVTAGFPTGYANQKFIAERSVANTQESYDYPVIRMAEVYLNYAEAMFEKNGLISDADLDRSLNLVRNRVNKTMPKLSNAFVGSNGLDMRTEIRRERTIELYLEGFRVDDLKRWNTAVAVLTQPLIGVKWTGTTYQTTWTAQAGTPKDANGNLIVDPATNRMFSDKNYLLPLPTQQIQLNPNLSQTPGF
jgi:hypothetical protein